MPQIQPTNQKARRHLKVFNAGGGFFLETRSFFLSNTTHMARQKGKSTRSPKESTNVPHSKRRRKEQKQQQEQQNAHSPPQEDVHDARPTDTFMELDTPLTDLEGEDSDDDESIDWETVELPKWAGATEVDHTEKDEDDGAQQQYHDVQVVFETPRAVLK